jgi:membrane-associated HD superfamily phosphohydrolase
MERSLGQRMVRTAGIFQGLVALPVLLVMGENVFEFLWYYYYPYSKIYYFMSVYAMYFLQSQLIFRRRAFFNSLLAATIIFVVLVQRHPIRSQALRLYLEIAKSTSATAVWLWLLFDSIFGPERSYYSTPPSRATRIVAAALSVIVLL